MLPRAVPLALAVALAATACGGDDPPAAGGDVTATQAGPPDVAGSVTVYTCVSDSTIQPVIADFEARHPGTDVELFRAPTGELNARVAADERTGGLQADVVWACDPLTMQAWVDAGLVGGWLPEEADGIPPQYRSDDAVGVHVLYMLAVHGDGTEPPATWQDLADVQGVAVPDPAIAASALGALGWFAQDPEHGLEFYERLRDGGGVQLSTPDEVTTAVAQGRYPAGMTIANSAYAAEEAGSPVGVAWPLPGAVAVYGPVAVKAGTDSPTARAFAAYVVGEEGQRVVGAAGSYPTRPGVPGPTVPDDAPVVTPDWPALAEDSRSLLSAYQQVFGG